MKKLLFASAVVIALLSLRSHAAMTVKNDHVINLVNLSTMTATWTTVLDMKDADSISFQMTETCAKGQTKIQQSNDGVNFVDLNVAGSSMTFYGGSTTTISNQMFSIGFIPAYRYLSFSVTNTSAPASGILTYCNLSVTECVKSETVNNN